MFLCVSSPIVISYCLDIICVFMCCYNLCVVLSVSFVTSVMSICRNFGLVKCENICICMYVCVCMHFLWCLEACSSRMHYTIVLWAINYYWKCISTLSANIKSRVLNAFLCCNMFDCRDLPDAKRWGFVYWKQQSLVLWFTCGSLSRVLILRMPWKQKQFLNPRWLCKCMPKIQRYVN
jgi:hypothetical protein